jgi:hypothetical protein
MLFVKVQTGSQTGQPLTWKTGKMFHMLFYITPTNVNTGTNANPYVAGGDTLDLTQLMSLLAGMPGQVLPTFEGVVKVELNSARPQGAAGSSGMYQYSYAPGTSLTNGTMQVFTGAAAQSALTELTAGNYPANVLNDTIQGEAIFVMP